MKKTLFASLKCKFWRPFKVFAHTEKKESKLLGPAFYKQLGWGQVQLSQHSVWSKSFNMWSSVFVVWKFNWLFFSNILESASKKVYEGQMRFVRMVSSEAVCVKYDIV